MDKKLLKAYVDESVFDKIAAWSKETGQTPGDVIGFLVEEYERICEDD